MNIQDVSIDFRKLFPKIFLDFFNTAQFSLDFLTCVGGWSATTCHFPVANNCTLFYEIISHVLLSYKTNALLKRGRTVPQMLSPEKQTFAQS